MQVISTLQFALRFMSVFPIAQGIVCRGVVICVDQTLVTYVCPLLKTTYIVIAIFDLK